MLIFAWHYGLKIKCWPKMLFDMHLPRAYIVLLQVVHVQVHSSSLIAKSMRAWSGMFSGLIVAYEEVYTSETRTTRSFFYSSIYHCPAFLDMCTALMFV